MCVGSSRLINNKSWWIYVGWMHSLWVLVQSGQEVISMVCFARLL